MPIVRTKIITGFRGEFIGSQKTIGGVPIEKVQLQGQRVIRGVSGRGVKVIPKVPDTRTDLQEKVKVTEIEPEIKSVRFVDIGTEEQERVGGFAFTGRQAREGGAFQIKKTPGTRRKEPQFEFIPVGETLDIDEAFEESILGRTEKFLAKDLTTLKGRAIGGLFDVGQFVSKKTGLSKIDPVLGLPPIKKSSFVPIASDILTTGFLAPTLGTTTQIEKAFAQERVVFAGKQFVGDKGLTRTDIVFATESGRKGIGIGFTKRVPAKTDILASKDVIITKGFGFGGEIRRGIQFPTGRIITKPSGSFFGVQAGIGQQAGSKTLDVAFGRLIRFSKKDLRGKKEFADFVSPSISVADDKFAIVIGGTKSTRGSDIFGGILKKEKLIKPLKRFDISGTQMARPILDQKAFTQTQALVSEAIKIKPLPPIKTSFGFGTSGARQVMEVTPKQVTKQIVIPKQVTKQIVLPKPKIKQEQKLGTSLKISTKQEQISAPRFSTKDIQKSFQASFSAQTQPVALGQASLLGQAQRQKVRSRLRNVLVQESGLRGFSRFFRFSIPKTRRFAFPFVLPELNLSESLVFAKGTRKFAEVPTLGSALKFEFKFPQPRKRTKREREFGVPIGIPFEKGVKIPNLLGRVTKTKFPKKKKKNKK